MTKRILYACLALIIGSFPGPLEAATDPRLDQQECPTCIAITILSGQTLLLPDDLHGLTVLLRVADFKTTELASAITEVQRRRGKSGVLLTVSAAGTPQEAVFRLRQALTELRSRLPADALLVLEEPSDSDVASALAGYVDLFVGRGERRVRPGRRSWTSVESSSLETALAATRRGDAERWLLTAPEDALAARALLHELARRAAPPPGALVESVEVRGARQLTADEIVARHQAAARRQASRVRKLISRGDLTLTFEAPGFAAPIIITSETIIYQGLARTELEQRDIRVNGISFRGSGTPRLPIIEPERAAALPLVITLTNRYRYRRLPDETIAGIRCHVVAFEPADTGSSLFHGRAAISMDGFAMVRTDAAQTRLRGPIVSSEQIDEYREFEPGVWLLRRSEVRQLYEGAAHRTPIQRVLTVSSAEINPEDFEAQLEEAYRSSSVMLRDTAEGYRYLRRSPVTDGAVSNASSPVIAEAVGRSDRVRTLAAGVIVDPNISIPLPFAGLSYVDFNLLGTGTQLNVFFGGTYGQLAFSVPSVGSSRWQLGGRAFGIMSSYNDRSFRAGREIFDENVRQTPAHASVWLLRPLTPRLGFRAAYELDYIRLRAAPETAADFTVPADQVAHGIRIALDGQRGGWAASLWWNAARRADWQPWGRPGDFVPAHRDYQRFGATLSRSLPLTPTLVTRVEAALASGRDLDRFSRYSFGAFDNRFRGYPSALVRYDRGGVVRTAVAWSASRVARLDGFFDTALVRDRGYGRGYRDYTGVGAAVEVPLPLAVLAAVEWGYGLQGVRSDGRQGTHVVRVTAFRVF